MAEGDLYLLLDSRPPASSVAEWAYELMGPLTVGDEQAGWPLLRLLEALTRGERPVWELVEDPGMVEHLAVDVAPAEWLPWLAAIVGARFTAAMTEAQRRIEVKYPSGYERGRVETIVEMVRGRLTGHRVLIFRERYDGHAYWLVVRTRLSETPNPDAVRADLRANVPMANRLDYAVSDERDWQEVADTWTTWADIEAAGLTWDDVNIP